eukprot:2722617-Pleurochrysis_carterae.AAC.1
MEQAASAASITRTSRSSEKASKEVRANRVGAGSQEDERPAAAAARSAAEQNESTDEKAGEATGTGEARGWRGEELQRRRTEDAGLGHGAREEGLTEGFEASSSIETARGVSSTGLARNDKLAPREPSAAKEAVG